MVVLYHFCNFISILIFIFVNFIQKYISFLCNFTCFSLLCAFLTPFLTSFPCFFISEALKYHFIIFSSWKFHGNLLQFLKPRRTVFPGVSGSAPPPTTGSPVFRCASRAPGSISKIRCKSSCPPAQNAFFRQAMGVYQICLRKIPVIYQIRGSLPKENQRQFQRTAPGFEIFLHCPVFLHIPIGFFL